MTDEVIQVAFGNEKMGDIPSLSLIPVKDCANCIECANFCYALRYYNRYKNTRSAYQRNSRIFRDNPYNGVNQIEIWINKRRTLPEYFRIHVAGDFLGQSHITAYIKLAKKFPTIKFLAFTKRHDLNFSNIPSNIKIIHSFGLNKKIEVRYKFSAYVVEDTVNVKGFICEGSCIDCKECFEGKERLIIFKRH